MKRRGMVLPLILVVLITIGGLGVLALRLLGDSEAPIRRDMSATLVTNAALDGLVKAENWLVQQAPLPVKGSGVVSLMATDSEEELMIALPDEISSSTQHGVIVQTKVYWAYYRCEGDFALFRNHWRYPVSLRSSGDTVVEAEESGGFDKRAYVIRVSATKNGITDTHETLVTLEP